MKPFDIAPEFAGTKLKLAIPPVVFRVGARTKRYMPHFKGDVGPHLALSGMGAKSGSTQFARAERL